MNAHVAIIFRFFDVILFLDYIDAWNVFDDTDDGVNVVFERRDNADARDVFDSLLDDFDSGFVATLVAFAKCGFKGFDPAIDGIKRAAFLGAEHCLVRVHDFCQCDAHGGFAFCGIRPKFLSQCCKLLVC